MKFYVVEPRINETKFTYYTNFVKELCVNEDVSVFSLPTHDLTKAAPSDYVFLGLGFFELFDSLKPFPDMNAIRNSPAKKIAYIHKVKNRYEEKIKFCKSHGIEIIFTTTPLNEEIEKDSGIKTHVLEYGSDPHIFKPLDLEKQYDIGFSGALHENKSGVDEDLKNLRIRCRDELQKRDDLEIFWSASDETSQSYRATIADYARQINQSKMWIAITGPAWDVNGRVSEITLCKTVLFSNDIPGGHYDYFEDGVNCIRFKNDLSDFHKKIDSGLEHQKTIAEKGYQLATSQLTPNRLYRKFKTLI